jgi:two-component system LytT family response regulator
MAFLEIYDHWGVHQLRYEKIIRIQSIDNYSKIYFDNNTSLVVSKVLRWFENCLPPDRFIRVHRSHLLNNTHICKIDEAKNDQLILSNGELIRISRRKKTRVVADIKKSVMKVA